MNIHFVYAGDVNNDSQCSPVSITRNLYRHLLTKFDNVYYYDWCHTGEPVNYNKNDVILAHPNYNINTIGRKLMDLDFKLKVSMHPLHHKIPHFNSPFNDLVDKVDAIFSIMGPYWYDTLETSEFHFWKDKITRFDMCVDSSYFKYQRERFNVKNERSFVYIGNNRPEKGLDILYEIFKSINHKLTMYGNIDHKIINLPNVEYGGYASVNSDFGKYLCNNFDFFINTSISDANPTTCTEAAAFGIPVVCTKGSGYWPDEPFINIEIDNFIHVINKIQNMNESDLLEQSIKQRKWVEEKCNWELFCNKVTDRLFELCNA